MSPQSPNGAGRIDVPMRLRVRLFASYREIAGARELAWTAEAGETVADLVARLVAKYPRLGGHRDTMLIAVNLAFAPPDAVLHDGDEVALMPPVSGGAG